jgi:hypothetical protein
VVKFSNICPSTRNYEVKYSKPSWYFGVAGGANFNFYRGSTQQIKVLHRQKRFMMVLGWTFHCTAFRVSSR